MWDYPGGPNVITRVLITRKQVTRSQRGKKERSERRCYEAGFDNGGRGHKLRNAGNL